MKKGRTFSFDLPKLKLGAFKYENRPWNDANPMAMEPESPGEVPKSVRPLPNDLEAALRAACTGVLRNNKPSHEYHKGGKAQLDYATIRRGGGNQPAPRKPDTVPTTLSKSTSNEDRAQHPNRESVMLNGGMNPGMSHRISHVPATAEAQAETQESSYQVQLQRSRAQSRADQLMAGPPATSQDVQRTRTNSHHSRSQSTPQGFWTAPSPQLVSKFGSLRQPKPAPRAQSMETTPAPLHDSAKEFPWSLSPTKPTKPATADQPIQPSHEAPAPPLSTSDGKKEDASPVEADWMQEDSEIRRILRQQAFAESALSRHTTWIAPKPENAQEKMEKMEKVEEKNITEQESEMPALVAKMPERKPVPSAQAVASPTYTSSLSSPTIEFPDEVLLAPSEQPIPAEEIQQVVAEAPRAESRNGRGRTRGNGVPMNSRAASRARSVTRDVKNFIRNASRNASRTRQPNTRPDDASTRSRRPSISRDVANNVKEFFRPGTAAGKQSLDVPRSMANLKSKSHESFVSARSDASPAKDTPMQLSQRSSRHNKNSSGSTGRNSFEVGGEESITPRTAAGSEAPQQKRNPDLNRALPPLPRLDSWHAEPFMTAGNDAPASPQAALKPPKDPLEPSLPSPTSSITMKKLSSRESRSPLPSPKLGGVHDYVALRMGAPVSRQSSKAKIPHEHGNPNLTHQHQQRSPRPPMSRRAPTDPKDDRTKTPDRGSGSSQAKEKEYQASRRRSKSVQEVNAPALSEKLRQASANSPDGRPIHAMGQAKLINTTPSRGQFDGLANKIGRKLSTKRRNPTPTQYPPAPPAPPPHRELPLRKAKTATSTPDGLSRANSTYHAKKRPDMSRKMSMEEYGQMYDGRFHENDEDLMVPPPPVAVGSSKNSPRLGLGNFLPSKFQQQQPQQQSSNQQQHQQHAQQQSVSKKWWHLGLGSTSDNMDAGPRSGTGMEQTSGGLGVRY